MGRRAPARDTLRDALRDTLHDALRDTLRDTLRDILHETLRDNSRDNSRPHGTLHRQWVALTLVAMISITVVFPSVWFATPARRASPTCAMAPT